MIRFVDIGFQIDEDIHYIAYFNTVTDQFITICGENIFESLLDVGDCMGPDHNKALYLRLERVTPKEFLT